MSTAGNVVLTGMIVSGLAIGSPMNSFAQNARPQGQAQTTTKPGAAPPAVKTTSDLSLAGVNAARPLKDSSSSEVSPALIKLQVLLDRQHFSPGVIDGRDGDNLHKAMADFQQRHDLPKATSVDEPFWNAVTKGQEEPALIQYEITQTDLAYKFTPDLPADYAKLSKLPNLNYQNMREMLAERFHMDERLLAALNPDADFETPGAHLVVANVTSTTLESKIHHIDVDKKTGQLRAVDESGALVVAYPATVGSEELPSPTGSFKVKGVAWRPKYSYDPQKNFKQGNNTKKLSIPSGPNNPVGSVYIALTKPTYGIHGTPEPSRIDKTGSHGCVRLTNWDAEELAHNVRPGVTVTFVD